MKICGVNRDRQGLYGVRARVPVGPHAGRMLAGSLPLLERLEASSNHDRPSEVGCCIVIADSQLLWVGNQTEVDLGMFIVSSIQNWQ